MDSLQLDRVPEPADASASHPVASSQTTKVDRDGNPKKKRKQLVACDSCRLRRVRCDKGDVGDRDCSECDKKGIRCTDTYVKSKPKVVRSGKLIQEARRLFGDGVQPSTTDETIKVPKREVSTVSSPRTPPQDLVRRGEARIITSELARSISNHLIEVFHAVVHLHAPTIPWDRFQTEWDASGRDTQNMSPTWECVSMVLQAWGSRHSDHPAIVGKGGPSLSELNDLPLGTDLTSFGIARDWFAEAMKQRALATIDQNGALRKPSSVCTGALVLMEFLCSFGDVYKSEGRHLMSAAAEHMRSRSDGLSEHPNDTIDDAERAHGGIIFWTLYTRDALSSTFGGRFPALSLDDIAVLCQIAVAPMTEDPAPYMSSSDPNVLSGLGVISIFRHLTSTIRSAANVVSSPSARRCRLDQRSVHDLWKALDLTGQYMRIFRASTSTANWPVASSQHLTWFRDLIAMRAQLTHAIHINITDRLEMERRRADGRDPMAFRYFQELEEMKATSDLIFLNICREYAELVRTYPRELVMVGATSTENIPLYLQHMADMPSWEEGGPADYPATAKKAEVFTLINAVKMCGWSWPDYHRPCEAAFAALTRLDAVLMQSRVPTPTSGYFVHGPSQPQAYLPPTPTSLSSHILPHPHELPDAWGGRTDSFDHQPVHPHYDQPAHPLH